MPRAAMPAWDPNRLRLIRNEKGLTMAQLAARADLEYSQVKRYSLGHGTPPPHALVALARALDVETAELAPLSAAPDLGEYRWHAGLQLDELAARVNLSPAYVGEIARGAGPITDAARWAEALGVTSAQVLAAWEETRRKLRGAPSNETSNETSDEPGGQAGGQASGQTDSETSRTRGGGR